MDGFWNKKNNKTIGIVKWQNKNEYITRIINRHCGSAHSVRWYLNECSIPNLDFEYHLGWRSFQVVNTKPKSKNGKLLAVCPFGIPEKCTLYPENCTKITKLAYPIKSARYYKVPTKVC